MKKTIGIFAHVDSGKTTLCEQILYKTNVIRSLGRVDKQSSFMDSDELEKKRGITIFSGVAHFEYSGDTFYLIDTPGHTDFVCETERTMDVLDCAVLVISGTELVQSHTLTLWRMLKRRNVPVVLFINKADRMLISKEQALGSISKRLREKTLIDFSDLQSEQLIEDIAAFDDELMLKFFDGEYDKELWQRNTAQMTAQRLILPCVFGSALNGDGVDTLLNILSACICIKQSEQDFSARVFKVMHDGTNRLCFMKIESGEIKAKQEINGEKINELRLYNGEKYIPISSAGAGDIVAAAGIKNLNAGDTVGALPSSCYEFSPVLCVSVEYPDEIPETTMMSCLKILQDEEPMLKIEQNKEAGQITVQTMGAIQLEVLQSIVKSRFDIDISYGERRIIYKETVASPVIGNGHFEPLRHYAEVSLKIEPSDRGSGISFESGCSTDFLALNWQRLIETHVFEKMHRGVLTGSQLADVKITLLAGRAHEKHTEGGDFRQSVYRAIRQGLMKAQDVLLEPYYAFEFTLPEDCVGKVMSDLSNMSAEFSPPDIADDTAIIQGKAPAACMEGYPERLISIARGKADITLTPCGYEICHNPKEVMDRIGYNPEADTDNTPDSVFCSHGAGHTVKWNMVDNCMHCKVNLK